MQTSSENNTEKYDFIVLGGGVSGLSFAKRISEHGHSVLVLEKEQMVGGLSRTVIHNGYYLDFCAHRFHTNNKNMLEEVLSLDGLRMNKQLKKSRIYMFGKYLKYPFELQNLLRAMPVSQSILCGFSFFYNYISTKLFGIKPPKSYKDWFTNMYGARLYEFMCKPYTSKIWHIDPSELSADWAEQRFGGENLRKLLNRILKKLFTLNFSSYNLEDESIAPDGGYFYYPKKGIQELPEALARAAKKNGASIKTSSTILKIDTKNRTVTYQNGTSTFTAEYRNLISTIPLHHLYNLQDNKDLEVETALKGLKYMDIIFVYLFINKEKVSNDHWLYFPDKEIIFNRAVEFSNWSNEMCPKGTTSICFDITSFEDGVWNLSEDELVKRTINDAVKIKYIENKDVLSHHVVKIKYAYPFYDLQYKNKLDKIVGFLESDSVSLLGRTGVFKYNNADNSIEMGFNLAEQFLSDRNKHSIYTYQIKNVSL